MYDVKRQSTTAFSLTRVYPLMGLQVRTLCVDFRTTCKGEQEIRSKIKVKSAIETIKSKSYTMFVKCFINREFRYMFYFFKYLLVKDTIKLITDTMIKIYLLRIYSDPQILSNFRN